jgi:dTDP-L-rhamnose 4-epimerase
MPRLLLHRPDAHSQFAIQFEQFANEMSERILITGGAGFIGSHVADELLRQGYKVRVLDNLSSQVHGDAGRVPDYLSNDVEFMAGDVRDPEAVRRALGGIDAVFHFAAMVGVGQSMYQVANYTAVNNQGTANLLQAMIDQPVEKLIVASSMSLYGEGLYRKGDGSFVAGTERELGQLKSHDWEVYDQNGECLAPVPTPETKLPSLSSIYALSKFDQERMCLLMGRAYGIPSIALRFFNVYGTRQSLSNPYTGVMAIFASRLMNDRAPMIFEDGLQQRDFVSVHDIARACRLALESDAAAGLVFNVGSGEHYTIRELGERIAQVMGKDIEPEITGKYRVGDVRHCFADISRAQQILGYKPRVTLEQGLGELVDWLDGQEAVDRVDAARAELSARGLTV